MTNKEKKPTRAQIESKIKNAVVFIPRDKEYKSIYFTDRGIRIEITNEKAIISTNYHTHIFNSYTSQGVSRPYLYANRLVEIAYENDCTINDGYSFAKLKETLSASSDSEKQDEYGVVTIVEWWLHNIFSPLYSISETSGALFGLYLDYMHNISYQSIVLDEHKEDLTTKSLVKKYLTMMDEFTKDISKKLSDEEFAEQEIRAIQEQEADSFSMQVEEQKIKDDESKD